MQKLFDEVGKLDKRCYKKFALTEDILMEHAAEGMAQFIRQKFPHAKRVVVACGSGNNGADGIALARLLHGDFCVNIFYAKEPKSQMALLQKQRAELVGVGECNEFDGCDILVDAIVGTGFNGGFDAKITKIINNMNLSDAYKIACDVPSGYKFYADTTLTMGALKKDIYLDAHKDFVGDVKVVDLGISREIYEGETDWYLLDFDDMRLPFRDKKDTHKGSFGHLALACGQKRGASIMSAKSALRFGAGLVTLVGFEDIEIPHDIMYSHKLPKNTTALACGMGLGDGFSDVEMIKFLDNDLALICDADVFHNPIILEILKRDKIVLTPHAKEFISLLKQTKIAEITVEELQKNRFGYAELFSHKFPQATLLLKGANVIVACGNQFFINPHGTQMLAKGGSGDVLSGLVGALLAQGYTSLDAAITASLTHTKLASKYGGADFSLTPDDLIDTISKL